MQWGFCFSVFLSFRKILPNCAFGSKGSYLILCLQKISWLYLISTAGQLPSWELLVAYPLLKVLLSRWFSEVPVWYDDLWSFPGRVPGRVSWTRNFQKPNSLAPKTSPMKGALSSFWSRTRHCRRLPVPWKWTLLFPGAKIDMVEQPFLEVLWKMMVQMHCFGSMHLMMIFLKQISLEYFLF